MISTQSRGARRLIGAACVWLASVSMGAGCSSAGDDAADDGGAATAQGGGVSSRAGNGGAGAAGAAGARNAAAGAGGEAGEPNSRAGGEAGEPNSRGSAGSTAGGSAGAGSSAGSGDEDISCGNGDPSQPCAPSATCSNSCQKISNQTCVQCENDGTCSDFVDNCLGPAATPFDATQQSQCYAVLSCIQASNCDDGSGSLGGSCYCGSLGITGCQAAPYSLSSAGAPDGPCAAAIQAGLPGITSNTQVLGVLTAPARPAGAAMQRINCQKQADNTACLNACGFTSGGAAFP